MSGIKLLRDNSFGETLIHHAHKQGQFDLVSQIFLHLIQHMLFDVSNGYSW